MYFDNCNISCMKNQYQFMINVGKKFEPPLKNSNKKKAGASYADLARWGIQILNQFAWVGDSGLMYSLLEDKYPSQQAPVDPSPT